MRRRDFLRAGLAAGAVLGGLPVLARRAGAGSVALIVDPEDQIASSAAGRWAIGELREALSGAGLTVLDRQDPREAPSDALCIVAGGARGRLLQPALAGNGAAPPDAPEGLALAAASVSGRPVAVACGYDARGLVYALLELADRVRHASGPEAALRIGTPVVERPANGVRSVMRQFTSEPLDKPWYHDREMWPAYLDMLATHRFNRFHLAFGLGYDFLRNVEDAYFLFAYPFLLEVPGYRVRATNLPDEERDRNLETLRFIARQTVARGLEFQLGIWMHGYSWPDSPRAQHTIEGLTPDTHAAYCRDALTAVLKACPEISSIALRTHGESGVPEGSYAFWRTIFDGVPRCGRRVEVDLHAKGLDTRMIDAALETGMPVNVALKAWAEHQGLPYHQAAIREQEMPVEGRSGQGLMTLSEGARSITRYGYGDLLRDDRRYTVTHRVFSGTQRLLLWGDPAAASAYSRAFGFCGSAGTDLMEPMTCRGRRGTGKGGSRTGYAHAQLEPRWDWQKYRYWYRVWGRLLYNPETTPAVWQRHFGGLPAGRALESSLAHVSRILPIVSISHMPSAACDAYWPEVYWNQPMVRESDPNPYTDSPSPKTFQNVSPLDPQLFSRMSDCAEELLRGRPSGKYSPVEVSRWLEDLALRGEQDLRRAGALGSIDWRRAGIDIEMLIGLGRFFAAKFRSGVLYAIHERTGDRQALDAAIRTYKMARAAWAGVARRARGVYADDLSASDKISNRGAWLDRLPAIDADIARMEDRLAGASRSKEPGVAAAIAAALGRSSRAAAACDHRPPARFRPGGELALEVRHRGRGRPASVILCYRHVNQAERFQTLQMTADGDTHRAVVPAQYTDSMYPLLYYFHLTYGSGSVSLYPGFSENLLNQPYFVVRRA
jgi:hypothetical protein